MLEHFYGTWHTQFIGRLTYYLLLQDVLVSARLLSAGQWGNHKKLLGTTLCVTSHNKYSGRVGVLLHHPRVVYARMVVGLEQTQHLHADMYTQPRNGKPAEKCATKRSTVQLPPRGAQGEMRVGSAPTRGAPLSRLSFKH